MSYMQLKKHPEEPIDRSDAWVLARKDKDGNFKNENVKEKAEKIVSYSFIFQPRIFIIVPI